MFIFISCIYFYVYSYLKFWNSGFAPKYFPSFAMMIANQAILFNCLQGRIQRVRIYFSLHQVQTWLKEKTLIKKWWCPLLPVNELTGALSTSLPGTAWLGAGGPSPWHCSLSIRHAAGGGGRRPWPVVRRPRLRQRTSKRGEAGAAAGGGGEERPEGGRGVAEFSWTWMFF